MKRNRIVSITTYSIAAILFGVLVSELIDHNILEVQLIRVLTICLLAALCILCWILGWMNGHGQD